MPLGRPVPRGVTSDGYYRLDKCAIDLATVQQPVPVMVGGNGDRVLRVAARHADIVGVLGLAAGTGPKDNA